MLATVQTIVHVDFAIEDAEQLGTVIHVPAIGLVRPMQARRRAFDLDQIARAPGPVGPEAARVSDHARHQSARRT